MAAYQGMVTPPVFWPMLQFVDAGTSRLAGRPAQGLAPIESAIELMGGPGSPSVLVPELLVLRGDIHAALDDRGTAGSSAAASYEAALDGARRLGARMSELRAATRLCGFAADDQRAARLHDLRSVYETFTEGFATADLAEAREILEG
jgi:hypothetical protein